MFFCFEGWWWRDGFLLSYYQRCLYFGRLFILDLDTMSSFGQRRETEERAPSMV
jgi:hypothetical protein